MAMLAKTDNDQKLLDSCKRLFDNITNKKISIIGGIGSDHVGEKFSYNYDIPYSDTYNETCASIALAMFAGAMQDIEPNSKYGDIIERIYYNGFISGVSLEVDKFFYTNPLEIDQKKYARSTYQPISERVKVFDCSCCPPNVVRMLASIPCYAFTVNGNTVYCNQFINGETSFAVNGENVTLNLCTNYPNDGTLTFSYHGKEPINLHIRIPSCAQNTKKKLKKGLPCANFPTAMF